jgi:DeoR/GlpR family transcriptional regulator of sugar metabolism
MLLDEGFGAKGMSILREQRKERIADYLRRNAKASVEELRAQFDVSGATIRRYLEELSQEGKVQRVRGGAALADGSKTEPPIVQRGFAQSEEKQLIARRAAELVEDGQTVFLGSGSTVLEVARRLRGRSDITVITNSLPVINLLSNAEQVRVIATGGLLRNEELSLIGHLLEVCLAELRADNVIIGIQGIDPVHGLTNEYLPETVSDRAILKFARRVIVVADHTKLGRTKPSFVAELSAVDTIVTDPAADPVILAQLRQMGIRVLVAE